MPSDPKFQAVAKNFVPVRGYYDGLKGKIITWSFANGNDNHDPSVLAWVIDPQGEVIAMAPKGTVYQAGSFTKFLEKHATASFPLVDVAAFKILTKEAAAVAGRKKLGATMKALRGFAAQTEDAARQAEAKTLQAKLQAYADYRLGRAKAKQATDPAGALAIYKELSKEFKGDAIGDAAKATHDTLKKDPAFKKELQAFGILAQAIKTAESKQKQGKPHPSLHGKLRGLLSVTDSPRAP